MKARVKATGEIVEFDNYLYDNDGYEYSVDELDFSDDYDYWEKLKHQYAGMAMQGFISNSVFFKEVDHVTNGKPENLIAAFAINISTALIEKLKGE